MAFRVARALRPAAASLRLLRPSTAHRQASNASGVASSTEGDETPVKETSITDRRCERTLEAIQRCLTLVCRSLDDPYFGISTSSFPRKILSVLLQPVNEQDVEIKPDGMYIVWLLLSDTPVGQ